MFQIWSRVTFLHWKYRASAIEPLLPRGLEPDLFDGAAWVGLVPFVLHLVRGNGAPVLPGLSQFPETNVRTYVRGPGGATGVWFFSLDAARLAAVLGARATFGLPYFWSRMRVRRQDGLVIYCSDRRPGRPARLVAEVETGESIGPESLTVFDHYLTARFRLFSMLRGSFACAQVEHPPWPLKKARLLRLEQSLIEAAGLHSPEGPPVIHYSEGVAVTVGPVRKAGSAAR
jgi:uncharacterized protein YqjF (DUF2071 family)